MTYFFLERRGRAYFSLKRKVPKETLIAGNKATEVLCGEGDAVYFSLKRKVPKETLMAEDRAIEVLCGADFGLTVSEVTDGKPY